MSFTTLSFTTLSFMSFAAPNALLIRNPKTGLDINYRTKDKYKHQSSYKAYREQVFEVAISTVYLQCQHVFATVLAAVFARCALKMRSKAVSTVDLHRAYRAMLKDAHYKQQSADCFAMHSIFKLL